MTLLEASVGVSDPIERCDSHTVPQTRSGGCRNTGVHHVGLHASNPAASAAFYRDVLGMQIIGGSSSDHPVGATAFLSSRPDEESHEIALFANPALAHVAFKVSSLAELRSVHARVLEMKIPIKFAADHGVSLAFYFDDPDGNMVEVYWPTRDVSGRRPQTEPLQPQSGRPVSVPRNDSQTVPVL